MRSIILTPEGIAACVDNCDFITLSRWEWSLHRSGYAVRQIWYKSKTYMIYMHRQILGLTDREMQCDHINRNKLDNRFCNLRIVTHQENMRNRGPIIYRRNGTSIYTGVCLPKDCKRWRCVISYQGKQLQLGWFNSEIEAAQAYNNKSLELFGDEARLNVIQEEEVVYND